MSKNREIGLFPKQGECVVGKFLRKEVRKTFYNDKWWLVLENIVEALTESKNPKII
jgi:hypothetical protein